MSFPVGLEVAAAYCSTYCPGPLVQLAVIGLPSRHQWGPVALATVRTCARLDGRSSS